MSRYVHKILNKLPSEIDTLQYPIFFKNRDAMSCLFDFNKSNATSADQEDDTGTSEATLLAAATAGSPEIE